MVSPSIKTIKTDRLSLHYQRDGVGQRLLFLGGTGWDLREDAAPFGTPLHEQFDILHFDQRGMGQSDKPQGPYSMLDYAKDAAALMEAMEWPDALVFGFSFGGMVAQELAINFPKRVKALTLVSTTSGGAGGSSAPIHEFTNLPPLERAKRSLEVADLRFSQSFQAQNPVEAQAMIESRLPTNPEFMQAVGAIEGRDAQLEARARHDCYSRLSLIEAPTLVIGGESDGQAPKESVTNLAAGIPDATLYLLPGAHGLIFENDATYIKSIEFFQSVTSSPI